MLTKKISSKKEKINPSLQCSLFGSSYQATKYWSMWLCAIKTATWSSMMSMNRPSCCEKWPEPTKTICVQPSTVSTYLLWLRLAMVVKSRFGTMNHQSCKATWEDTRSRWHAWSFWSRDLCCCHVVWMGKFAFGRSDLHWTSPDTSVFTSFLIRLCTRTQLILRRPSSHAALWKMRRVTKN